MQYNPIGAGWNAAQGTAPSADNAGGAAPSSLAWGGAAIVPPGAAPCPDWAAVRCRLGTLCDPVDLTAYLGRHFAYAEGGCDHTLRWLASYFDADAQQALAVFQFLDDLDVRCDCEAFFILRMLTR